MYRLLFFLLCLLLPVLALAQRAPFPMGWTGEWEGTLTISRADSMPRLIPMELHILPMEGDTTYEWTIIYGSGEGADRRAYVLRPVNPRRGHWVVDEQNGILLDGFVRGSHFISAFSAGGSRLLVSQELRGEKMSYDIAVMQEEPSRQTGGMENIPDIFVFQIDAFHSATLSRR